MQSEFSSWKDGSRVVVARIVVFIFKVSLIYKHISDCPRIKESLRADGDRVSLLEASHGIIAVTEYPELSIFQ
jgi:hypothetical protein